MWTLKIGTPSALKRPNTLLAASTMCPMCLDSRISTKVTFWSPTAPLRPSTCSSQAWFKRFTASSPTNSTSGSSSSSSKMASFSKTCGSDEASC